MIEEDARKNPYAEPRSPLAHVPPNRQGGLRWALIWAAVFCLNLIVPLMYGWDLLIGRSALGMLTALTVMFSTVFVVGKFSSDARKMAISGGCIIALTQMAPILQMSAGLIGIGVTERLLSAPTPPIASVASGFVVTAVTGGVLILAAGLAGAICLGIQNAVQGRRKTPV